MRAGGVYINSYRSPTRYFIIMTIISSINLLEDNSEATMGQTNTAFAPVDILMTLEPVLPTELVAGATIGQIGLSTEVVNIFGRGSTP